MKRPIITTIFALSLAFSAASQVSQKFNSAWLFARSNDTANAPGTWQSVELPHDWSIYTLPDKDAPSGNDGGYYGTGIGWYKKTLHIDRLNDGERVMLDFEGVYQKATVYVNGKRAAWHGYGYTPFSVDATKYLKTGENTVTVCVNNSEQKNCRWYSGSGIYRNVWLRRLPAVSVSAENVVFNTDVSGKVTVEGVVENNGAQSHTAKVSVMISSANGLPVSAEKSLQISAKSTAKFKIEMQVANPKLWSFDEPNIYYTDVRIDGASQLVRHIGFRKIEYDAENGFRLNGKQVLINGACVHHDNGLLGAAAPDAAEFHKVRMMKDAGFNLLRTSHNPPSEAFLLACDMYGMMVIDEAFDGWRTAKTDHDYAEMFDSLAVRDVTKMVVRDRHHPCIVAWSIGNEVIERKDIRVIHTAKMLKNAILKADNTRPVTEALCAWDNDWEIYDPHADVLDIAGYNYMIHKHKSDHERDPKRVIWQTESFPKDAFHNFEIVKKYPYVIGDIVWTGLDYLGESGIGLWRYESWPQGESWQNEQFPAHGAYCGDVDITGYRKPISYYRDILWNGEKAKSPIHISVREPDGYIEPIKATMWSTWPTWDSWNWQGWEDRPVDVEVCAVGDAVKLFQDNRLVGEKTLKNNMATFTVNYRPGTLRAECNGNSATLTTAAKPSKISLKSWKAYTDAGYPEDVAFVEILLTDSDGNPCAMSSDEITVSVSGGTLLAFGNADLRNNTDIHDTRHAAFHGRAQAIVKIPAGVKSVVISAKGNGIKETKLKVR